MGSRPRVDHPPRPCEACGAPFKPAGIRQKFCVPPCAPALARRAALVGAARERHRARSPHSIRNYARAYRQRHPDRAKASSQKWYLAHQDYLRNKRQGLQPIKNRQAAALRKSVRGRSCRSCGRSDSEATWGSHFHLCNACALRSAKNGACSKCGVARFRVGGPGCRTDVATRACECPRRAVDPLALLFWDAIRLDDREEWLIADLAAATRRSERWVHRYLSQLLALAQRWDPGATLDLTPGEWTHMRVLRFRVVRVRAGLQSMIEDEEDAA